MANQLENIAYLAIEGGRLARAARLLGAAEAIRETAASSMAFDEVPEYQAYVERLGRELTPSEREAEWSAGRAMTLNAAVGFALAD